MTLSGLIIMILFWIGWKRGNRIMQEVRDGKREGVARDDHGVPTYIFYDMD